MEPDGRTLNPHVKKDLEDLPPSTSALPMRPHGLEVTNSQGEDAEPVSKLAFRIASRLEELEKETKAQKEELAFMKSELQAWKDFHARQPYIWKAREFSFTADFLLTVCHKCTNLKRISNILLAIVLLLLRPTMTKVSLLNGTVGKTSTTWSTSSDSCITLQCTRDLT